MPFDQQSEKRIADVVVAVEHRDRTASSSPSTKPKRRGGSHEGVISVLPTQIVPTDGTIVTCDVVDENGRTGETIKGGQLWGKRELDLPIDTECYATRVKGWKDYHLTGCPDDPQTAPLDPRELNGTDENINADNYDDADGAWSLFFEAKLGNQDNTNPYLFSKSTDFALRTKGTTLELQASFGTLNVDTGEFIALGTTHKFAVRGTATVRYLYVDGALAYTGPTGSLAAGVASADLLFGLGGTSYLPGTITNVQQYARTITAQEAIDLTNGTVESLATPLQILPLQEQAGTTAFDASGNSNDGSWVGF